VINISTPTAHLNSQGEFLITAIKPLLINSHLLHSDAYSCHIVDLITPDNDISLAVSAKGQHQSGKSNADVTTVQMKKGMVTHFPEMSKVVETFPNMYAFSITFTKLKTIRRQELTSLKNLKYFLISDNEIEAIPSDTFYDMQRLEFLDICRNKVSVMDPHWTVTMPDLKIFRARSNLFKIVPKDMFTRNPLLEEILLDKNKIQMNEKDFTTLSNLKIVAMLENPCVSLEYCKEGTNDKCLRSLQQFNLLVNGYCNVFSD
jgi:Leucine-rich repeat (LRR) protein